MGLQREDRFDEHGVLVESFEDQREIGVIRAEFQLENDQALAAALASTDWFYIRQQETAVPAPKAVAEWRTALRAEHEQLEREIEAASMDDLKTGPISGRILSLASETWKD